MVNLQTTSGIQSRLSILGADQVPPSLLSSRGSVGGRSVSEAYGDYLAAAYPWQWFITMTSSKPTHPEAMLKAFRYAVSVTERKHLGRRPKLRDRIVWVAGEERTKLGQPHLHAIMWQRHDLNLISPRSRDDFRKLLNDLTGWSMVEKPRSPKGVSRYCSKYLSKDGELQFGPTFGVHRQIRL
jgi:hypothetical protein